tara:strand:+ start:121 stop:738 length:618 start_codon:yes stop_codon:yes gene_type:complete
MNTVNLNDLNTGDILLFDERPTGCLWKILDGCIKLCTDSKYSHSAMVLKNPSWLGLPDGIYVWESTGFTHLIDPVDNKKNKFGVQIHHIDEYTKDYGPVTIYVRQAPKKAKTLFTKVILNKIYKSTYDKSYDDMPLDWLQAMLKIGPKRRTDMFWCSAFVSYILTKVGVLDINTDWSMMSPQDLSFESSTMKWNIPYCSDQKVVY